MYREFLTANVKSIEINGIRSYDSFIPPFLKGRPRKFIEHCLPRIKNDETDFNRNKNLLRIDIENKLFEVKSSNDQKVYSCDLKLPRSDCMDWCRYKLPCKHMFYVSRYVPGIDWNCLPEAYLQQDFLKVDDRLLERALADSTCPEDAKLAGKGTENYYENDTGVDVNIEYNLSIYMIMYKTQ